MIAEALRGRGYQAYAYYRAFMPSAQNDRAEVRERVRVLGKGSKERLVPLGGVLHDDDRIINHNYPCCKCNCNFHGRPHGRGSL